MDVKLTVSSAQLLRKGDRLYIVINGRAPSYGASVGKPNNIKAGISLPSQDVADRLVESLKGDQSSLTGSALQVDGIIIEDASKDGVMTIAASSIKRLAGPELEAYRQVEMFAAAMRDIAVARVDNNVDAIWHRLLEFGAGIGWSDSIPAPLPNGMHADAGAVAAGHTAEEPSAGQAQDTVKTPPSAQDTAQERPSPEPAVVDAQAAPPSSPAPPAPAGNGHEDVADIDPGDEPDPDVAMAGRRPRRAVTREPEAPAAATASAEVELTGQDTATSGQEPAMAAGDGNMVGDLMDGFNFKPSVPPEPVEAGPIRTPIMEDETESHQEEVRRQPVATSTNFEIDIEF